MSNVHSDSVILFFGICMKEVIIYTCVYMGIYVHTRE